MPLTDGGKIDIKVSVMYDPMGWKSSEIVKETDTHHGSEGEGEFNWRFKVFMCVYNIK